MNLIKILLFVSLFFTFAFSKGEVSKIFAHKESATAFTYNANGNEYKWGQGENLIIDGFKYNGHRYNYVSDSPIIKIRRVDNSDATGEPCGLFAERIGGSGYELVADYPQSNGNCDMAKAMGGRVINIGALDLFKNVSDNWDTAKNIERVDFISPNGIIAPAQSSDLSKAGHVVTEKSGNNEIRIAAILSIDSNNNPTSYGTLVRVMPYNSSSNFIRYKNCNIELSNGNSTYSRKLGFYRDNKKLSQGQQGKVWHLGNTNEPMGMAFVSLDELGVGAGQKYYGFSYFGRDVTSSMNLTNINTFPHNTSGDTADPYGGVASYFADEELQLPISCQNSAFMFHNIPTEVSLLNLTTGVMSLHSSTLTTNKLNGVGYNKKDNFIWGYDQIKRDGTLLRIGKDSDGSYVSKEFNVPGLNGFSSYNADIDDNGHMYLKEGGKNNLNVSVIDLDPNSATYLTKIRNFTLSQKINIHDWAFNPIDDFLYAVTKNDSKLYKINPTNGTVTFIGDTKINKSGQYGASFFDKHGFFYVYNNKGGIYQIDVQNSAVAVLFSNTSAVIRNDGAMCSDVEVLQPSKLYISDSNVTEGDSGITNLDFTVALDNVSTSPITFKYQLFDGNSTIASQNAIAPSDYDDNHALHSVTIPANTKIYTITIPIKGDTEIEENEKFTIIVSDIQGAIVGNVVSVGTIINDDVFVGEPFTCSQESYLTTSHDLYSLNLSDGSNSPLKMNYTTDSINAIGYNVKDNFIWGWDLTQKKVVRIDANYTTELFETSVDVSAHDINNPQKNGFTSGDVSKDGILYLAKPSLDHKLHRFDLNSGVPIYLGSDAFSDQTIHFGDFAINPIDNYLYTTANKRLYRIDPSNANIEDLGLVQGDLTADDGGYFHSYVFDKNGNMYFYSNDNDKKVFKLDLSDFNNPSTEAEEFITLDWVTGSGDGARCANAEMLEPQQEPFVCNDTLYLSNRSEIGTGSNDSGATWLHSINRNLTPYTYTSIGNGYVSADGGYNAIGYNVQDNFIYALYKHNLLKIDKNGVVKDLGVVQGLNGGQLYSGEFDRDGNYYVSIYGGGGSTLFKIDIDSVSVVDTIPLKNADGSSATDIKFWDMAIDKTGNYFYMMIIKNNNNDANEEFAKLNISTGVITRIGDKHSDLASGIDLTFSDKSGNVYAMEGTNGFYKIDTQSGNLYKLSATLPLTFYNDGTSCPDANISEPPSLTIDDLPNIKEGDNGLTNITFTLNFSRPTERISRTWVKFKDGITAIYPTESAIKNEDYIGSDRYIEFPVGTTTYELNMTVIGDTKVEHDEEFYIELYNSNHIVLLDNHAVGTIIDDDMVTFNVERQDSLEKYMLDNSLEHKYNLYTQIAKRDFNYTIVAYDQNSSLSQEKAISNLTIKVELVDMTDSNSSTNVLQTVVRTFENNSSRIDIDKGFGLENARSTRNARFIISYPIDENNTVMPSANCLTVACIEALPHFKEFISNTSYDAFSIRPAGFKEMLLADDGTEGDHLATSNQYETYGIALAAGYEYELQVKALGDKGAIEVSYEPKNNILSPTQEVNATLVFDGNKTTCIDKSDKPLNYYDFDKGINSNKEFSKENVGHYHIHVSDENWTNIDHSVNISEQGCIIGSSTNEPDADGRFGCSIGSTFDIHSVDPYDNHYDDLKVYFQPYKFGISLNVNNFLNNGRDYLYMGSLSDSNEMSIVIDGNITALSENDEVTTNFIKSCFSKKVDLSLDYRVTADSGVYDNNLTQLHTTKNTPLMIQRQVKHNNGNFSNIVESSTLDNNVTLAVEDFDDNLTGYSYLKILYNIRKNLTETTNPIKIEFKKAHVVSEDSGSTLATNEIEDFIPTGLQNLGVSKILYFARVSSYLQHYPKTNKKSINTPLFVEVYCRKKATTQNWCRDTMEMTNHGMIGNGQKTYKGWYLATNHDSLTEGTVLELKNISNNSNKITTNHTTSIPPFVNGKIEKIQTLYIDGELNEKVTGEIEIVSDSWLRHNSASYFVTFQSISGMAGIDVNTNNELGYNLMRNKKGTLNGITQQNGKISW